MPSSVGCGPRFRGSARRLGPPRTLQGRGFAGRTTHHQRTTTMHNDYQPPTREERIAGLLLLASLGAAYGVVLVEWLTGAA